MTQQSNQTPQAVKLANNPNTAMTQMMAIIDNFRALMLKETEALESADAGAFLNMQDDKITIARAYQHGVEQMLARKDELRAADPTLRGRLEAMQKGFHDVAIRNLKGLERMKNGTNRLHDKVMMAARETALSESRFAYGSEGRMQSGGKITIGVSEQA